VTEQWAQFSIAGPRARDTLRKVIDGQHDISDAALPYLGAAELTAMGGVAARLFRISFSGELAYEIAVPARYGEWLIEALMEAGKPYDVTPYGTEALGVMRIEKGHVGGNELTGQTTATDLGLGKMMSKKKDYIGRVMADRPGLTAADRPSLAGFKPVDRDQRLRAGAHFARAATGARPRRHRHGHGSPRNREPHEAIGSRGIRRPRGTPRRRGLRPGVDGDGTDVRRRRPGGLAQLARAAQHALAGHDLVHPGRAAARSGDDDDLPRRRDQRLPRLRAADHRDRAVHGGHRLRRRRRLHQRRPAPGRDLLAHVQARRELHGQCAAD
jgi:hypothetical protein